MKNRHHLEPWQWDYTHEKSMFGIWYEEDLNAYDIICDLIIEGMKKSQPAGVN